MRVFIVELASSSVYHQEFFLTEESCNNVIAPNSMLGNVILKTQVIKDYSNNQVF